MGRASPQLALAFIVFAGASCVSLGISQAAQPEGRTGTIAQGASPQSPPSGQTAAPAAAPAEEKSGPGWALNCKSAATDKGLECRLSQTIVTQNRQLLTNVTVRVPADKAATEIIVQLPLGVYLPAGAMVKVDDGTPQRLNFRACDLNGCYAQSPVSPTVLQTMREGEKLLVTFQNLDQKPIEVPLSLDGFDEAYAKIR